MDKKISILIPVYNEANTIKECVENVLKSSENFDMEIIISDNNSIDGTIDILKKISHPKIKVFLEKRMKAKVQI